MKRAMYGVAGIVATIGFLIAAPVSAQDVDAVLGAEKDRTAEGKASQDRVDKLSEDRRDLEQQYRGVLQEIEGLEVYNKQLERQVNSQLVELEQLEESITRATVVNRQILPLMLRMIGALEQFVKLDVPFLLDERLGRVQQLAEIIDRADVSIAEKFRRVLEAYQIESEYGRTIEAYRDTLEVGGTEREVDVLRIGRIGLYYQTLDEAARGVWNLREKSWVELDSGYSRPLREGLRIARKQTAPDLLTLPVNAPEEVKP